MTWIALIVVALVVIVIFKKSSILNSSDDATPYVKASALFTPAERSFFGALTLAAEKDFILFGKVRIADVLFVKNGVDRPARNKAFHRISSKHFDFVLCSPTDLSVLCAIELNDNSHNQVKRQERDAFVQRACEAACLPLITFQAKASYSVVEVASAIAAALSSNKANKSIDQIEKASQTRIEPHI
ncbi:MAG: DUF2726 domain-containing protein [Sterolibacterium sp.]